MNKMPMKFGDYEVVKLRLDDSIVTKYFLPRTSLERKINRWSRMCDLKSEGYVVLATVFVDKETYLNLRINDTVEDYCYQDRLKQDYRYKYRIGELNRDTYIDTMKSIQDYKWTCLKRLDMQMRRLFREDFDCYNEIAVQLYDQFLRSVM
jgi:hypothetical protein